MRDGTEMQPPAVDYRAIADGLRSSDEEAAQQSLTDLICHLHRMLAAWLKRHGVRDENTGKDILQKTWEKVWQSRAGIDPAKFCKAWVFRICVNILNDEHREKEKLQEVSLTDVHRDSLVTDAPADPLDACDSRANSRRVMQDRLLEVISNWPDTDQRIISAWMYADGDEWTDELSKNIGKSPATLRKRLFDLKKRLQKTAKEMTAGDGAVCAPATLIVDHLPPSDPTVLAEHGADGRGDNHG